jgi:hypothetical protein
MVKSDLAGIPPANPWRRRRGACRESTAMGERVLRKADASRNERLNRLKTWRDY